MPTRANTASSSPKPWSDNRPGRTFDPVHIAGIATTSWLPEQNAVVDELVYNAVSEALSSASLNRHEIGLTVTASMDLFDGRSISSGLTNSASGGYLKDSYRLESDVGTAIIAAAQPSPQAMSISLSRSVPTTQRRRPPEPRGTRSSSNCRISPSTHISLGPSG